MHQHLIFFDSRCPMCSRAIGFILDADREESFLFAPLEGTTAQKELTELIRKDPKLDTIVLLEHYGTDRERPLVEGKAILRICWYLGGGYAALGLFSFLPSLFFDWMYRIVAKNRYRIFSSPHKVDPSRDPSRFLP